VPPIVGAQSLTVQAAADGTIALVGIACPTREAVNQHGARGWRRMDQRGGHRGRGGPHRPKPRPPGLPARDPGAAGHRKG